VAEKKLPPSIEVKRAMIEPTYAVLSIRRQCALVGLNRASYYRPPASETPFNLRLMRLIDEQYTATPFYGYRKACTERSECDGCPPVARVDTTHQPQTSRAVDAANGATGTLSAAQNLAGAA
jgi:hypothetical protein